MSPLATDIGRETPARMCVPAGEEPTTERAPAIKKPDVSGNETILVVEDEPAIRRVVIRTLAKLGYDVLQAGDGVEALEVARNHEGPIHLLVTDVMMPHMDGCELAETLLSRYDGLRVLYTSGYTGDTVIGDGIERAEIAFLAKPYDLTSLRRKIRDVLDRVS